MTQGRNPFEDGVPFSVAALNSIKDALLNEGVRAGAGNELSVSSGAGNFDVDVADGEVIIDGSLVSVGSGTLTLASSNSDDRVDLLTTNKSGTLNDITGNPASTAGEPVAPDIPSDEVLLAAVLVRGGSSEVKNGDIFDDYASSVPNDFYRPQISADSVDTEAATIGSGTELLQVEVASGNHIHSATSDNTWGTRDIKTTTVNFSTDFPSTPEVWVHAKDFRTVGSYVNESPSSVDVQTVNYTNASAGTDWHLLAIGI